MINDIYYTCDKPLENDYDINGNLFLPNSYNSRNMGVYLSSRIQKFYDIWIRLFAQFNYNVKWNLIDFRIIMCKSNDIFNELLRANLIDDIILYNFDKILNVEYMEDKIQFPGRSTTDIILKNEKSKCFAGNKVFVNQIAKMVMDDNIHGLKVYLWFFHNYANNLQNEIFGMIKRMVTRKYKFNSTYIDRYTHRPLEEQYNNDDKLFIPKYHCSWYENTFLSLRIQKFYDIWIRLFAYYNYDVKWSFIDFRVIMCRTSTTFSKLVCEKLIDELIILNIDKIHKVKFDDNYLCEDLFEAIHRMGLDITMKMAKGNFGAMCKFKRYLMNYNMDEFVVKKKFYRSTDLIKQYIQNKDYDAYERVISMLDFTSDEMRDLFTSYVNKEGDTIMKECLSKYIVSY